MKKALIKCSLIMCLLTLTLSLTALPQDKSDLPFEDVLSPK
ncbi:hypothetical protein [Sporolactobacillus shoreicorticis]|uniref:Uncharacterized protein n=1 Tax=Sporolactobacillus shoreicorticis TaxID=1923877 RepID=A0ABW5S1A3_9BACL|nr:hypothetical protein [Sporolactobacillus shoreicorticis]